MQFINSLSASKSNLSWAAHKNLRSACFFGGEPRFMFWSQSPLGLTIGTRGLGFVDLLDKPQINFFWLFVKSEVPIKASWYLYPQSKCLPFHYIWYNKAKAGENKRGREIQYCCCFRYSAYFHPTIKSVSLYMYKIRTVCTASGGCKVLCYWRLETTGGGQDGVTINIATIGSRGGACSSSAHISWTQRQQQQQQQCNINKPHQSESDQEYVMIGANSDLLGCNLGYLLPMIKWRI